MSSISSSQATNEPPAPRDHPNVPEEVIRFKPIGQPVSWMGRLPPLVVPYEDAPSQQPPISLRETAEGVRWVNRLKELRRPRAPKFDERAHETSIIREFQEGSRPFLIEGAHQKYSLICFDGLASTGQSWRKFAISSNLSTQLRASVFPLGGHTLPPDLLEKDPSEISLDYLRRRLSAITHNDLTNDILIKVRDEYALTGKKVIVVAHSTAALAALDAASQEAEKIVALFLVGPPFVLRNYFNRYALRLAAYIEDKDPRFRSFTEHCMISFGGRPPKVEPSKNQKPLSLEDILEAQSPSLKKVPLSVLTALSRLQSRTPEVVEAVGCLVECIYGSEDKYVRAYRMQKHIAKTKLVSRGLMRVQIVQEAPHSLMLSEAHLPELCGKFRDFVRVVSKYEAHKARRPGKKLNPQRILEKVEKVKANSQELV